MRIAIHMRTALVLLAVVSLGVGYLALSGGCYSDRKVLEVGAKVPAFDLEDYTGKKHTLKQYTGKIVLLDFCSHECPFSRGADPALLALAKKYKDNKNVVVLGIDSHYQTTPEEIQKYAKEKKLTWPILKDPANKYADAMGATRTPEIYIVDKEGKLAYHGAFDDRSGPEAKPSKHYTADAVAALVAGEEVKVKHVKAWGCTIKRAS